MEPLAVFCRVMNSKGSSVSSNIRIKINIASVNIIQSQSPQFYYLFMENSNQTIQESTQKHEEKPKIEQIKHQQQVKASNLLQNQKEQATQVKQQPISHQKESSHHIEAKSQHKLVTEQAAIHQNNQQDLRKQQKEKEESKKLNEENLNKYIKHFKQTKGFQEIQKHSKKIIDLINLANHQSETLQINLGVGQNKGKTSIKYDIQLKEKLESNFAINLQVKIKKKAELKAMLEAQIKRSMKLEGYHPLKLCDITFSQTQKTLKIKILSHSFEEHIFKDTIHFIENAFKKQEKPVLKVQGELIIKNSIRNDEISLQKKIFVKWLGEGLSNHLQIQGNSQVIHYFTQVLSQYFPIFKAIRSGQINLKLKSIANIDKLFEKLGINEISEQTPTLSAFLTQIMKQYLHTEAFPWITQLIKRSILFSSTIPNQKISIEASANISHLHFQLSLSSDACKQFGQIANSSLNEIFS